MKVLQVSSVVAVLLTGATLALGADTIRTTEKTYGGQITKMSPLEVVIEVNAVEQEIPVNQIENIFFDDEPTGLKSARTYAANRAYENALGALEKIDKSTINRREVLQEIDYLKAYCTAQLALEGTGDIKPAGSLMIGFARDNAGHYRYLDACEVIGDLLVALGAHAQAEEYYTRLAQAPWADYKMRAGVAAGRARLAQGKVQEAAQAFDSVLKNTSEGELADAQRLAAKLGKARCFAAADRPDEAIKMVEEIIQKADPEDIELHARAYNALGTAHRKANRLKEALLAFLHVDTLYFQVSDAHAEALSNLAQLWNEVGKTEEAVRAQQILEEQYRNSPWAK
jgi:tetratricopeptide (TPR) repeat protein